MNKTQSANRKCRRQDILDGSSRINRSLRAGYLGDLGARINFHLVLGSISRANQVGSGCSLKAKRLVYGLRPFQV